MKKVYCAPVIEVEDLSLTTAIAGTCSNQVNLGPDLYVADWTVCKDDYDIGEFSMRSAPAENTSFAKESKYCTCYYNSGGEGYFMS